MRKRESKRVSQCLFIHEQKRSLNEDKTLAKFVKITGLCTHVGYTTEFENLFQIPTDRWNVEGLRRCRAHFERIMQWREEEAANAKRQKELERHVPHPVERYNFFVLTHYR